MQNEQDFSYISQHALATMTDTFFKLYFITIK